MSNDKMNWATIAPESRIYKGKNLYRWDVSPGLEHHCGICATPLHNLRAKTTCVGKHVEPCYRFHQQLHFVGKSHECFGCNASDEMHHNRHKEILKIVRQINVLDQGNNGSASPLVLGEKRRESSSTSAPTDASSETFASDGSKMTRRERKKAKKTGNASTKDKTCLEIFSTEELDFISEAIHLTKHESKGAWAGTYNYGQLGEQATPNQNTGADDAVTEPAIARLEELTGRSLANMTPRQRKTIKKYSTTLSHTAYKNGTRKFSAGASTDVYDGVDPQIFFRLGVDIANPANGTKTRKELSRKLVAAIKEDLDIIEREKEESALRREGFWRWAGKTAFQYIARVREDFDWATGQKIEKKDTKRRREQDFQDFTFPIDEEGAVDENAAHDDLQERAKIETPKDRKPSSDNSKTMNRSFKVMTQKQDRKLNMSTPTSKSSSRLDSPIATITPPTSALDRSAWTPTRPMKFAVTPVKISSVAEHSLHSPEVNGAWEIVKPGKGARQPLTHYKRNLAEPQVAYRKPLENNTIYLK